MLREHMRHIKSSLFHVIWSQDNMKKTGFDGYIYDFSTDYNAIAVSDIQHIHNYLMKKNRII